MNTTGFSSAITHASGSVGNVKRNVAPRPGFALAHSRPPCDSMIMRLIASPIPVPPVFVVANALKICSILSAGIPTPVSLTDTITVQTADGTTKDIVISINGANDAAEITGDASGSLTEASGVANGTAGTSPATGDLDASDVDSGTDFSVLLPAQRPPSLLVRKFVDHVRAFVHAELPAAARL